MSGVSNSTPNCWRALARQLLILYNSKRKAKSVFPFRWTRVTRALGTRLVGCKIEDMCSQLCFFLISGHSGVLVNEISIDFEQ